ncbi:hypothetical protein [Streptomyces sp. NPDC046939]|uniref:hypothetical protein n=1 Tax=Streptomyces sp. NPDC046939 TaxID=3155376 RepID=UPI0034028BC3
MEDTAWRRWLGQMTHEVTGAALYRLADRRLFGDGVWQITREEAEAAGKVLDGLRARAALQGAGETLMLAGTRFEVGIRHTGSGPQDPERILALADGHAHRATVVCLARTPQALVLGKVNGTLLSGQLDAAVKHVAVRITMTG